MDPLFGWVEATALSYWLRESPSLWAFPFVLILHTVGLAFFVGRHPQKTVARPEAAVS